MKYRVRAMMTISVYTDVEADSPEQAIELAGEHGNQGFCNQCSNGNADEEWVTSGELDGEPTDLEASEVP